MALHHKEIKDLLNKLARGTISDQERVRLAHLAFEDPFLQDAIEGYEALSEDQSSHLAELNQRLNEETSQRVSQSKFHFWRIAASILLLMATTALMYFGSQRELGRDEKRQFTISNMDPVSSESAQKNESDVENPNDLATVRFPADLAENETLSDPGLKQSKNPGITRERSEAMKPPTSSDETKASSSEITPYSESTISAAFAEAPPRKEDLSKISGRIFDNVGNPLIGADIRSLKSDEVVSTDIYGRFVIDSTAVRDGLEITYAGYETLQFQPKARTELDSINLQEDQKVMNDMAVYSFKKDLREENVAARSSEGQYSKLKTNSTGGPTIGWPKYLAYIEQNRKMPKAARNAGIAGIVELSFYIDKQGKPNDIKILKSLGYGCDTEAIRLIQQGPDWHTLNAPTDSIKLSVVFK